MVNVPDFVIPDSVSSDIQERIRRDFVKDFRIRAEHAVFSRSGDPISVATFPLSLMESQGTQKLFAFAGPLLDVLENGLTLIVDEIDARFHPLLTRAIIQLFQSPDTNSKGAQLVFITHDTNLLDSRRFRRDQIWFVEKDRFGASHLYSLADFKGVRKNASFEEEYFHGRYGAIPFLGGMSRLFSEDATEEPDADAAPPAVNAGI